MASTAVEGKQNGLHIFWCEWFCSDFGMSMYLRGNIYLNAGTSDDNTSFDLHLNFHGLGLYSRRMRRCLHVNDSNEGEISLILVKASRCTNWANTLGVNLTVRQ